jgi:hypothetical protein
MYDVMMGVGLELCNKPHLLRELNLVVLFVKRPRPFNKCKTN